MAEKEEKARLYAEGMELKRKIEENVRQGRANSLRAMGDLQKEVKKAMDEGATWEEARAMAKRFHAQNPGSTYSNAGGLTGR